MILGPVSASATTTFNLSYIPHYIDITNIATVTRVRVTSLGSGVVLDLDAAGLAAMRNTRFQSVVATTVLNRFFLANGLVKGINCIIEVTNGATATVCLAGSQQDSGTNTMYFQGVPQKIFANTGVTFTKFAVLALPSLAAGDYVQMEFRDGTNSKWDVSELRGWMAQYQSLDANASDFKIDNIDSLISSVTVYCATDQLAYVQKYLPIGTIEGKF
jgi:hypothetical protein